MKITISPDGEIQMETNGSTPAEIAGTVLSIQRELRKQEQEAAEAAKTPVTLNTIGAELWDWLVDNDNEKGIHVHSVAQQFNITKEAAAQRCQRLYDEGHAVRVSWGRYRAVTGA